MNKRDIKFRAYSKETKIMSNTADLMTIAKSDFSLIEDNVIWLEYTGLKDKNGKEIYEGDIVNYRMIDEDEICEVFWDAGTVKMKFRESDGFQGYSINTEDVSKRVSIVGNIYENPELIEG